MERTGQHRRRLYLAAAAALAAGWLLRGVLTELLFQLAAAWLLTALALPVCRLLERKLPPSLAAGASFALLAMAALLLALWLIPAAVVQFRQLSAMLPQMMQRGRQLAAQGQTWLEARGVAVAPLKDELFTQLTRQASSMVSGAARALGRGISVAGKLFLAPLLAFYLLRDRRRIADWLTLLIPVKWRARAVRAAREMRRETANFLRGQLLVSLAVGALTAFGLLLAGTPGWLVLGALMGAMELIPYIGPVLAGVPAVLLALQNGWLCALWTLLVLLAVQQAEGTILSPRLLSGAVRMHPLAVLLAISAGSLLAGTVGMLLALPAVVSLRGALRGLRAA